MCSARHRASGWRARRPRVPQFGRCWNDRGGLTITTKGRGVVPRPGRRTAVRAMKVVRGEAPPQDDASDTLHRWTAARRAVLLEDKLDDLVTVLARIASALERRAVS